MFRACSVYEGSGLRAYGDSRDRDNPFIPFTTALGIPRVQG